MLFGLTKHYKSNEWPTEGLEQITCCPVCRTRKRTLLYQGLNDRLYNTPGKWGYYLCKGCGSAYLNPRPDRNSIKLAYMHYATHELQKPPLRASNKLSHLLLALRNDYLNWRYGYQERPSHHLGRVLMCFLPPFLRNEWDRFARSLPIPKSDTNSLLDVGCGNGDFSAQACKAGWKVQGIDFDPKAVEIAKSRGLNVFLGALENQNYQNASFDAVTHSHVIEHVHDPVKFLRECLRILKPGGRIWIATPNLGSFGHRVFKHNWHLLHPPHHLVLLSRNALHQAMQEAGADKVQYLRRGFHVTATWASTMAMRRGESPFGAKLCKPLLPLAWAVEIFDCLFPRFQEELVMTGIKPKED